MNGCVADRSAATAWRSRACDAAAAVAERVVAVSCSAYSGGGPRRREPSVWYGSYTSEPSGLRGHAAAPLLSALFFQKPGVLPSAFSATR